MKNEQTELDVIRAAAEQGDAGAQLKLGNTYAAGIGVDEDQCAAVEWHRKAAEQGNGASTI